MRSARPTRKRRCSCASSTWCGRRNNQVAPGLLTGASDPQNQSIAVNTINGGAYTPGASITLPSGAMLTVNGDGSFSYVPSINFVGTDSFTFTVADQGGNVSVPGTVNITPTATLSIVPKTISSGPAGTVIEEDVYLDNPNPGPDVGGLAGFNLALTFDPTVLVASEVQRGPGLPANWSFLANTKTPGVIGIGAYGSGTGLDVVWGPAPIVLASVQFTIAGTTPTATDIDLVPAAMASAGPVSTELQGSIGRFTLHPGLPGQITAVHITNGGSGYTYPPNVFIPGGIGAGNGYAPGAQAVLRNNGTDPGGDPVIAVVLLGNGSGYTSAPPVIFFGGDGSGAAATATIIPSGTFIPGVDTRIDVIGAPPSLVLSPGTLPAGNVNEAYRQTITATGGTGPYTFAVTSGTLPPGLTQASSGVLSGTPTAAGTYTFTITATDSSSPSGTGQQTYTVTINAAVTTSPGVLSLPITGFSGTAGSPVMDYPINLSALTDGTHVGLASATLVITFPPGVFDFPVGSSAATVHVHLGSIPLANGGASKWHFAANSFGDGVLVINLSADADVLTSTAGGSLVTIDFPVVLNAMNPTPETIKIVKDRGPSHTGIVGSNGTYTTSFLGLPASGIITIDPAATATPLSLSPNTLADGDVGAAYSQAVAASGGVAPYIFAMASGTLPTGLTLSTSGVLSGTPAAAGVFCFTITATDSATQTASQSYTVTINPAITPPAATLADAAPGVAYHHTFYVTGGRGPYAFAYTGTLPSGLTLNSSTGVLSGTPTAAGSYDFTITATDAGRAQRSVTPTAPI